MKITAKQLRQIIREEIDRIQNPEQLSEQSNEELSALFQKYADDEHPLIKKYIGTKTDRQAHDSSASAKKPRALARLMGFGTPAGRNLPLQIAGLIKRVEAEGESPDLLRAIEKAFDQALALGRKERKRRGKEKRVDLGLEDPDAEVNLAFKTEED